GGMGNVGRRPPSLARRAAGSFRAVDWSPFPGNGNLHRRGDIGQLLQMMAVQWNSFHAPANRPFPFQFAREGHAIETGLFSEPANIGHRPFDLRMVSVEVDELPDV